MIPDGEHYVLVAEHDLRIDFHNEDNEPCGPIVWETYLGVFPPEGRRGSSLEEVKRQRDILGHQYGETRIAKLTFIDDEEEA